MPDVSTRPMVSSDLPEVARLHEESLEAGFFGRLGRRFLARYYETFMASPYAVAFAVEDPPVAMLVGTTHNALHYRWVVRHRGLHLAVSGSLALLRRPRLLLGFLKTRLRRYLRGIRRVARPPGTQQQAEQPAMPEQVAVLSHVAVSAQARRRGLGARLVEAFVSAARLAGADRALLVTLEDSSGAEDFYLSLGWDPVGSKVDDDGKRFKLFELRLKERP